MDFTQCGQSPAQVVEPTVDRVWLDAYPPEVAATLRYPHAPVSELMESAAARFPERPACTIFGQSMTYEQLHELSHRLAGALAALGARPGRRVAMLLPNTPEYIAALQAAWLTGATVLQLSPLMVAEEIAKWLEATDCHLAITLDLLAPLVIPAIGRGPLEHVVVTSLAGRMSSVRRLLYRVVSMKRNGPFTLRENGHVHHIKHLVRNPPALTPPAIVPEEDVALMTPTGGTTDSPKVVMLTHANLIANAHQLAAWSLTEDGASSVLGVLPFFHAYGLTVGLLMGLAKGATVHLHPRFETKPVLHILEKHKVDMVPAVPAMLTAMNRQLRKKPRDLSFIRVVVSGASALTASVREEFDRSGPQHVVEGYGLSEASPVTHVNPIGERNTPGTVGVPLPDTDAKIVDEATGAEELPIGTVGELVVRGPQVMKGYYNNPAETARALRNGWLYTGDLAKRDAAGFFTIVDRKKDIIKTSGFLVFPAEVEEVLSAFPTVGEAAVIGIQDAERGELVKAMLVPRNGTPINLDAIERHCLQHLSKHKRPRQFEIVKELPKNFLGKVQRRRLREKSGQ